MKRINISETNRTAPSTVTLPREVVYVPGLSAIDNASTGVVVVNSVSDFNAKIGNSAYKFEKDGGNYPTTGINYSEDMSYYYAKNLVGQGLTVAYDILKTGNTSTSVADIYTEFLNASDNNSSSFDKIKDIGEYNIKYITSGAYPVIYEDNSSLKKDLMNKMVGVAHERGDAYAVVDHAKNYDIDAKYDTQIAGLTLTEGTDSYGTIFTGSGNYSVEYGSEKNLPASFGYLSALAKSVKTNEAYLAVAGVARGTVPGLIGLDHKITNSQADKYQDEDKVAVNAITNINPYGLTIWGNRTLHKPTTKLDALSFLNIRNMLCNVKKELREIALTLLFEQNSDVLWLRFKSRAGAALDKYVAGNGILNYNFVKNAVGSDGNEVPRYKLSIDVIIQPTYPVEAVDINVVVTNEDVTVA